MGILDGLFGGLSSPFEDQGSQLIRGLLAQGFNPMAAQPFAPQQPQMQMPPGMSPVANPDAPAIEVSRSDGFWRVVHLAASGAQYDRGTQYRLAGEQGEPAWSGRHMRKQDTVMRGSVSRIGDKFYYNEKVVGAGELRLDMTAKCEPR
jgi:hypothetical protein